MDFELNEEQIMLKTAARDFLEKECPKKHVREMMEDEKGYSPNLWRKMAELGWHGISVPEEYGGSGSTFLDLIILMEEMGRALVPGPFMSNVVLAGRTLLASGSEVQKKRYLPQICNGETIMTLAFTESNGSIEASGVNTSAILSGENFIINGTKLFVPDANTADYIICVTRTQTPNDKKKEDGISLLLVDTTAPGISIQVLKTLTGRKICEVDFRNVVVPASNLLGKMDKGWPYVKTVLAEAALAECAWIVGGARWILDTTVNYVKDREQFGVPVGSFQAIQHKCANILMQVEGATSIIYYASCTISERNPEMFLAISMAKAWCSDIYKNIAADGIQMHGGIGFTWDHDMHLYFRRAKTSEIAFGDGDYHRERVAELLNL